MQAKVQRCVCICEHGSKYFGKEALQALSSTAASLPAGCVHNLARCAAPRSWQLTPRGGGRPGPAGSCGALAHPPSHLLLGGASLLPAGPPKLRGPCPGKAGPRAGRCPAGLPSLRAAPAAPGVAPVRGPGSRRAPPGQRGGTAHARRARSRREEGEAGKEAAGGRADA